MEYCPICNSPLNIINSYIELVNDNTPDKVTEVYRCLDMACINKNVNNTNKPCVNYVGEDLTSPAKIVDVIKHREV